MRHIIGVIGLGYVGLPLAIEFGKHYRTIGFDINKQRINELKQNYDRTGEIDKFDFLRSVNLSFVSEPHEIKECNTYIISVPTPIDKCNRPDLRILRTATMYVGRILKKGDIVIYESTVYPGCTEEECVPILEYVSKLKYNEDFFCGYSPERINPGDSIHKVTTIKKITSGSTPEVANIVDELYKTIVIVGTYKVSSIKIAEAAKVIENSQRDINIAFMNELSIIFNKMGIDTKDVLEAASTKWNFLKFEPGLVGGHCIGVDPYYLSYKAEALGYIPQIILAGRKLNDHIPFHIANQVIKLMSKSDHRLSESNILVLGITFKENCPDIRNSKVINIVRELESYGCKVDVYDPLANKDEVREEYGIELLNNINKTYDGIILSVKHDEFKELDFDKIKNKKCIVYDVKRVLPQADGGL